jgi:uncharacterized protein
MSDNPKPHYRVQAGSSNRAFLNDSFVNFAASLGYGARNLLSGSSYQMSPISRNHQQLEMMYRGSWLVRQIIDSVAEDMTRAGVTLDTDMTPEDEATMMEKWQELQLWTHLQQVIKWARLYGGAIGVLMIDGQDPMKPLRVETISKGQFKGLMVLDRWMVQPSLEDTVRELGPNFGLPKFYEVISDAHSVPSMRVHYSRCIRFEGVDLPYWQKIAENLWGLSVIEPMLDRMYAFDSATSGAAQLMFKAHLRTYSVDGLRNLIAAGGKSYQAFLEQMGLIRLMQSNEGMTLMDSTDKFETHQYNFGGMSELLVQFGQQLSGAAQIPLVRLFGQSPAGLNATGESDVRNYYDMINSQQEAKLRRSVTMLFEIMHRHVFGVPLPQGFNFSFRPLWQLAENEKAQSSNQITTTILAAFEQGMIGRKTALKELKEQSKITGVWTNITDEEIEAAEDEPPDPMAAGMQPGQAAPGASPAPSGSALPGQPSNLGPDADQFQQPSSAAFQRAAGGHPTGRSRVLSLFNAPDQAPPPPRRLNHRSRSDRVRSLLGQNGRSAQIRAILTQDRMSLVNWHGLTCIIETAKGERRDGKGFSDPMPCHYGYISRTGSAEGGAEQMDCYIGDYPGGSLVYIIDQHKLDGGFDEHKVMLNFPNEQRAMGAYYQAFSDGSGPMRLGAIRSMSIPAFKAWLRQWPYDLRQEANGHRFDNGSASING